MNDDGEYLRKCTDKDLADRLRTLMESVNSIIHELDRRNYNITIAVGSVDIKQNQKSEYIDHVVGITVRSVSKSKIEEI